MFLDSNEFDVSREKHPVWVKLPSIAKALETYPSAEWIWWLDLDALIMTPHLDLHSYLLSPSAMKWRLLQNHTVIPNDRIDAFEKPLPMIRTGEVYRITAANLVYGSFGN